MTKKHRFIALALLPFLATSVFADGNGKGLTACNSNKDWIGNYTVSSQSPITGSTYVTSYVFHANGSVTGFFSGAQDQALSTGSISEFSGSWTCKGDGNIVFSLLFARYDGFGDLFLRDHVKGTSEVSIVDGNTLERVRAAARIYQPFEDPADPNAGFLVQLQNFERTYTRLQVAEGDLQ